MEVKTKNGVHVGNGTAKPTNHKAAINGVADKQIANGAATAKTPAPGLAHEAQPEAKQVQGAQNEVPKSEARLPQADTKPAAPELTLENKLKVVNDLHRKSIQRVNLIARMKQLEAFEVALAQENDELEDNPYQGCKLIIRDDKNREFVTTTPGLIRLTAQFIYNSCEEKRNEIEAMIVFPGV